MIPRAPAPAEPAASPSGPPGDPRAGLDRLAGVLAIAARWAGEDRLALIAAGSHAAGDAVWVADAGRAVSLSDLDLYAVVRDPAARRAARARAGAERGTLAPRLLALGLAAPLEVAFLTPADLAALPARPGTLELRRGGRVIDGDPSWLARVPAHRPADVPREEVMLLLENRAFELLWAAHPAAPSGPLGALRRRHAVLKCALELAAVATLADGEFPAGAGARVAWVRARAGHDRAAEPPWDEALAWRRGETAALEPAAAAAERLRTVRAWVATWRRLAGDPGDPARPFAAVPRLAARARARRRLREALRRGLPEGPATRLRHAVAGTPRHRLHAAAAALLILETAEAEPGADRAALRREHRRVARSLGHPPGPDPGVALVMAWDRGYLDGQRTGDWA